jgi:hypothetical protein
MLSVDAPVSQENGAPSARHRHKTTLSRSIGRNEFKSIGPVRSETGAFAGVDSKNRNDLFKYSKFLRQEAEHRLPIN